MGALFLSGCSSMNGDSSDANMNMLADMKFEQNRPSDEQWQTLQDNMLFNRATSTYIWALPLINTLGMKEASESKFGKGYNVLPVWKGRLNAKTQLTTPNSDVLYAMSYLDLNEGPMVMEAPSMLQGMLIDVWQRPIDVDGGKYKGDVGIFGPDGGKGGKFLILPPGYKGQVPKDHYVYRSKTNTVFVFLRGFFKDPDNLTPAVKHIEKTVIYPLGKKAVAKAMVYPDATDRKVSMLPQRNFTAWTQLKKLLDAEGGHLANVDGLGRFAALGIIKDQPFKPNARQKEILDKAAESAYKMSRSIGFSQMVTGAPLKRYNDRKSWFHPMPEATSKNVHGRFTDDMSWVRKNGGFTDIDARAWFFTDYYSWSPAMVSQTPGKGAFYQVGQRDHKGKSLRGDTNYTITLPSVPPSKLFWSMTMYEAENGAAYVNDQAFPSKGTHDNPKINKDGSITLYIGPNSPGKDLENNWLQTKPERGFFTILRVYGPESEVQNGTWRPGDIKKIS